MKKCIFCNGDCSGKKRAREHIFPQHLLRELSLLKEKLDHSQFKVVKSGFSGGHISAVPKERSLTYSGFLAGNICAVCNNGWMSKLEVAVQPFIYQLIRGEKIVQSLEPESLNILAYWAYKTSVVLSQSVGAWQHLIPQNHARLFYQNNSYSLSNEVGIFAYSSKNNDFAWSLCPTWVIEMSHDIEQDIIVGESESAYKIFLQLGKLMLLVCHCRAISFQINP
jgi:hypothetical protein